MNLSFGSISRMMMIALLLFSAATQTVKAQDVEVSYQEFYDELSPYGQWVEDPEYGNVWIPNEDENFRPYATNGYWAMTDYGNMWVSDAPYGWACYHYGRWTFNPYYGWVWIPGYEWAPAWVSWRSGGGYYGWAPMPPGYVTGAFYDYPDNYWVFVGPQYLYQPNIYLYYESGNPRRYIRRTRTSYLSETYTYGGGTSYYYGPRRDVIERESRKPVQVYNITSTRTPRQTSVSGNVVQVYRPGIKRETIQSARPRNAIRATQPVGRPQRYEYTREPEFRQVIQERNPNFKPRTVQPTAQPRQEPRRNVDQPVRTAPQYTSPEPSQPQPVERPRSAPQPQPRPQPAPQPRPQPAPQQSQPKPKVEQEQSKPRIETKSSSKPR